MKKEILSIILIAGSICFSMEEKNEAASQADDPISIRETIQKLCVEKKYDEALFWYARGLLRVELDWVCVENKKLCNIPKLFAQNINQLDTFFVEYQKKQSDALCREKSLEALNWLEKETKSNNLGDLSWITVFVQQIAQINQKPLIHEEYDYLRKKQLLEFREQLESVEKTPPLRRATK